MVGVGGARAWAAPPSVRLEASRQRFHAHLDSEDRLDASLGAGLGEAHGAVEAVVVGEGQGGLAELGRPVDQLGDATAAVEEAEVRVDVEVYEGGHRPAVVPGRILVGPLVEGCPARATVAIECVVGGGEALDRKGA